MSAPDAPDPISHLNATLERRYRIEAEIGSGATATVYLAEDLRHDRKVALKVLKPDLAAAVGPERFLAEIKTTANLQHPHILPLHDSGEVEGFLFFVTPYVDGQTLRDRIEREGPLGVEEAVKLTREVASALDHAHRQGVVHRDIKPGNILLSAEGEPIVADFGVALAVAHAGGGRITETGLSVGTPHYMSPEQAAGTRDLDPRTDVYALGCVLYEMLTGTPPYQGRTLQALLARVMTDPPPDPTRVRPSVPPHVGAAIRKALEKLPADRFATAGAFGRALADPHFRYGETAAAAGGGGSPSWKWSSLGLGVLAILLAVVAAWSLLRPRPGPSAARFELTLPDGLESVVDPSGANLALSPDGSKLVFVGRSSNGVIQLWLRSMDQLTPRPIPGTENAQNPRFSPDGGSLAFTADLGLKTVALSGAPPRTILTDSVPSFRGLAWGSDGMLYMGGIDRGISRVPLDGGPREEVVAAGPGEFLRWPDLLPDAGALLFTRIMGDRSRIELVSLETREVETLVEGEMARYAPSGHLVYASATGTLLAAPFDLRRREVEGTSTRLLEGVQVLPSSSSAFALSSTGVLVFQRGVLGRGGVPVWVGRDGSQETLDPVPGGPGGGFRRPALSPGGRRIAFEYTPQRGADPGIWIYDLDQSGTFSPLAQEGRNFDPFWSPDGREVGFSSDRDGPPALYARLWDGSGPARLLRGSPGPPLWEGGFTPDGRRLVYRHGNDTEDTGIAHAPPHPDSAAISFVDDRFDEVAPALSPDGRWLAYQSNESGRFEIYVRPFPGPGGRSPVSVEGGRFPVWAHGGSEIFYTGADNSLMVAAIRTEPDFGVESRERFASIAGFSANGGYTPSLDDPRLLAIRLDSEDSRVRIIVVQDFLRDYTGPGEG